MAEPVSLTEAKAYLRKTTTEEDALITELIVAARQMVEHLTDRALVPKTVVMRLDEFPGDRRFIELALPPARSLTSITYVDAAGATQTWATSGNIETLNAAQEPARINLVPDVDWPESRADAAGAVTITYAAGYATADAVPAMLKIAVKALVNWWYEQRQHVNIGNIANEVPDHLHAMCARYRAILVHGDKIASVASTES